MSHNVLFLPSAYASIFICVVHNIWVCICISPAFDISIVVYTIRGQTGIFWKAAGIEHWWQKQCSKRETGRRKTIGRRSVGCPFSFFWLFALGTTIYRASTTTVGRFIRLHIAWSKDTLTLRKNKNKNSSSCVLLSTVQIENITQYIYTHIYMYTHIYRITI